MHPGVYIPKDAERTLHANIIAAWLWTGRKGVIAGRAAAALHGAKWIDASTPIEVIAEHTRGRKGVIVHGPMRLLMSESWLSRRRLAQRWTSPGI